MASALCFTVVAACRNKNTGEAEPTATPAASAVPTPEVEKIDDDTPMPIETSTPTDGKYKNDKTISITGSNGYIYDIGVNCNDTSKLMLTAICKSATIQNKVGFYVDCAHGTFTTGEEKGMPSDGESNRNEANLYIDWTYDNMYPIQYKDASHYGLGWSYDSLENIESTLSFHFIAVDMNSKKYLDAFVVNAVKDGEGNVSLTGGVLSDVKNTNEQGVRDSLLNMAKDILANGNLGITTTVPFDYNEAIVEKVNRTYFRTYYDTLNFTAYRGKADYPAYAVTLNSDGLPFGHITIYFSGVEGYFECMGYDAYMLDSRDNIPQ